MASRVVEFDLNSLVKLLVHYTEGEIPLDSEAVQLLVSQKLPRWVALILRSKDWSGSSLATAAYGGTEPFHIRYECKRLMKWQGDPDGYGVWSNQGDIEAPKQQ